jgi:hypothetical protein
MTVMLLRSSKDAVKPLLGDRSGEALALQARANLDRPGEVFDGSIQVSLVELLAAIVITVNCGLTYLRL